MQFDHLVVAGETLAEAVDHVETTLGISMQPGGQHVRYGTHNALLGLGDGIYLEAIAIDPSATPQSLPRWFGLDHFSGKPRLLTWAARVPDLPAALKQHPLAGACVAMQRGDLRWRMAVAPDGRLALGGAFPSLLQWQTHPIPGDRLTASGCQLKRLEVRAAVDASAIPQVDARPEIHIETACDVMLRAIFQTPSGERVLT